LISAKILFLSSKERIFANVWEGSSTPTQEMEDRASRLFTLFCSKKNKQLVKTHEAKINVQ
jgi:hypothetical protein